MAVLGVTVAQVIMGEDHPVQALDAKTIHVCISSVLDARIPQCFANCSTHRVQVMAAQAHCGIVGATT